jgi:DNA-binding NtrC family response regulator
MNTERTILLVDDDAALNTVLAAILRRSGYSVLSANSAEQALVLINSHSVTAIITDLYMPHMSGAALLKHLFAVGKSLPSILITGSSELEETYTNAPGISAVLIKPVQSAALIATLASILT